MEIQDYIEKYGEYGGRMMHFWMTENKQIELSSASLQILEKINKNYNKNIENKEVREENIRSNISLLSEFYLSLYKREVGGEQRKRQIVIDPDEVRKLLAPWGYDKTNVSEYNDVGREVTSRVFDDVRDGYGIRSILFLSGAPASGKSSALRNVNVAAQIGVDGYDVVYDSPITSFRKFADELARPLLEKGVEVKYVQIYNDPVTTFRNMMDRGISGGRFLPCLYFLNGMLMQNNRPKEVAAEFGGLSGFTYMGIDNAGNVTKEKLLDAKEAERAFDYDITLSQITKMLEYAREYLEKKSERIKRTGQTGGARQDVRGGTGFSDAAPATRDNEDTIADVVRGLLHVEMALRVQLGNSLLHNAGALENPMAGFGREGVERTWYGSDVTDEVVNPKAIKDELIRCASTGESNPDLAEMAKLVFLGEELARMHISKEADRRMNPEKYLSPHYAGMLARNVGDESKFGEGEFATSERVFTLRGGEYVMGSASITGSDKVAEMFRHLEGYGVENTFAVYLPKGSDGGADPSKAVVQFLSSGDKGGAQANIDAIIQGALRCDAKEVYFVHNHPSGSLVPSAQDKAVYLTLGAALGAYGIRLNEGVILNTNSGKYATFSLGEGDGLSVGHTTREHTESEDLQRYEVLEFSKTVFDKNHKFDVPQKFTRSEDVAAFLSKMRFGEGDKIGYLVLDRGMNVRGNFFLNKSEIKSEECEAVAGEIGKNAIRYSGSGVLLYGRFDMSDRIARKLSEDISKVSGKMLQLTDIVTFNDRNDYRFYKSYSDDGILFEGKEEYVKKNNKDNDMDSNDKVTDKELTEQRRAFEKEFFAYETGIEMIEARMETHQDTITEELLLADSADKLEELKKKIQQNIVDNGGEKEHVKELEKLIRKIDSMVSSIRIGDEESGQKKNNPVKEDKKEERNQKTMQEEGVAKKAAKSSSFPAQIVLGYAQVCDIKDKDGNKINTPFPKMRIQLDTSYIEKNKGSVNITKRNDGEDMLNLAIVPNDNKRIQSPYLVISKRDGLDATVKGRDVTFSDSNSVYEFSVSLKDMKAKAQAAGVDGVNIPLNVGSFSGKTAVKINEKSNDVKNKLSAGELELDASFRVVNQFDRLVKMKQNLDEARRDVNYVNLSLGDGINLENAAFRRNGKIVPQTLIMLDVEKVKNLPESDAFGNIKIAVCARSRDEEYLRKNGIIVDSNEVFRNRKNELVPSLNIVADPQTYKNGQPYDNTVKTVTLRKSDILNMPTIKKDKSNVVAIMVDSETNKVSVNTYAYVKSGNKNELQDYLRKETKDDQLTINDKKPQLSTIELCGWATNYDIEKSRKAAVIWQHTHPKTELGADAVTQYQIVGGMTQETQQQQQVNKKNVARDFSVSNEENGEGEVKKKGRSV
jgi:hypothetical protein